LQNTIVNAPYLFLKLAENQVGEYDLGTSSISFFLSSTSLPSSLLFSLLLLLHLFPLTHHSSSPPPFLFIVMSPLATDAAAASYAVNLTDVERILIHNGTTPPPSLEAPKIAVRLFSDISILMSRKFVVIFLWFCCI